MDRRAFTKLMGAFGASTVAMGPWSAPHAFAQKRGGRLVTIVQPEPPILVTAINQQAPTNLVAGKIYEGLLRYDFDLKPLPGMAESWSVSPDGKTYTFKLFPNIRFHDGSPLTAEDVVFTCTKVLVETHTRARTIFRLVEKAEAPDPLTVVFTLKAPFGPFLNCFDCTTSPIIPRKLYEGTDITKNPANAQAIGSGPFKLKEWVKGSHIHLVRNEDYYRKDEPILDEIIYRIIPDAGSRAIALENGSVQLTQWSDIELFDVPRIGKLPNLEVTTKGYEFFAPHSFLEMNNRNAPFNDKRFRQAVAYAIDKNALRDRIFFGMGKVATGPVSSKTRFYEPDVKQFEYSLDKAKALLDEMGLKPGTGGKRVSVKFLVMPYGEIWQRTAEFIRQSLGRVGIDVVLEGTDVGGWVEKVSNWNYDITTNFLHQFGDPAIGVSRSYVTYNIRKGVMFTNNCGYSNPEIDQLFQQGEVEYDEGKRREIYSKMQRLLVEEMPFVWLLELDFPTIYDKKLKDVVTSSIGTTDTLGKAYFA
jgi:peptide/nickel transport system substrate-binding protein